MNNNIMIKSISHLHIFRSFWLPKYSNELGEKNFLPPSLGCTIQPFLQVILLVQYAKGHAMYVLQLWTSSEKLYHLSTFLEHLVLNILQKLGVIPLPIIACKTHRVRYSSHTPLHKFACIGLDWVYRFHIPPFAISQKYHIIENLFSHQDHVPTSHLIVTILCLPP